VRAEARHRGGALATGPPRTAARARSRQRHKATTVGRRPAAAAGAAAEQ